jgi:hypothetical protein
VRWDMDRFDRRFGVPAADAGGWAANFGHFVGCWSSRAVGPGKGVFRLDFADLGKAAKLSLFGGGFVANNGL